jgi:hypothetical protein
LAADPAFSAIRDQIPGLCAPEQFIGCSPQQVERFVSERVKPVRERYAEFLDQSAEVSV